MSGITRTAEHCIFSPDSARKQNSVAVERQECVFFLQESLEITCHGNSDRRHIAVSIAPCNPIVVVNPADTRIITVFKRKAAPEMNRRNFQIPVNSIRGESGVQSLYTTEVVHTKNPGITIFKRYNRTVEDAVGIPESIRRNDRIA